LTTWETTDERVLHWVFSLPPVIGRDRPNGGLYVFPKTTSEPCRDIGGLDSRDVANALDRLHSFGLITANTHDLGREAHWWNLRLSADGLRLLGEWPDYDQLATAVGIRSVLLHLSKAAPRDDASVLKKTAGIVARAGDDAVRELVTEATKDVME
jgi:hypothetical protein